ncbi:MAG: hypothetical protein ACI4NA_02860 [Succinivibrio sp.]
MPKGPVKTPRLPSDVLALAAAFSFTPPSYTDFRQAWDLREAMDDRPLFSTLANLSGKAPRQ